MTRNPRLARPVILAAVAAAAASLALPAGSAGAAPSRGHSMKDDLVARSGGHASFVAQTRGHGLFFGTAPGHAAARPADIKASAAPATAARGWLDHYSALLAGTGSLATTKTTSVRGGDSIVRFEQKVNGLPVVGGQVIVTLDGDNNLLSVNGETTPTASVAATPAVTAARAASVARRSLSRADHGASLLATSPVLSVLDPSLIGGGPIAMGGTRSVWSTTVTSKNGFLRHQVFVDAVRGAVVLDIDENSHANAVVCESPNGANSSVTNPRCSSGASISPELQVVGGDTTTPPTSASDADTFNAYRFAHAVDDFYRTLLGRNAIDGKGGELDSTVHFCSTPSQFDPNPQCPLQNAFWDGHEMVYGSSFASSLDVVGHEMTHGVTEHTSNLFSYYQSGALNESMSDVMGEMIQQIQGPGLNASGQTDVYNPNTPWLMGEDLPIGAVRNMADPTLDTPADPDRMTSSHYNAFSPWDNSFDSGGVHANDGVGNKAAYLIASGPSGAGANTTYSFNGVSMTGVSGADQIERDVKVANIYYRLDNLMSSGASYADVYNLLPQACKQLVSTTAHPQHLPLPGGTTTTDITSADCAQVSLAVNATEMNKAPSAAGAKIPAASPTCTNGGFATKKRLDTFEGTTNPLGSRGTYKRSHSNAVNTSLYGVPAGEFGQWWWSKSKVTDYTPATPTIPFQDQGSLASLWGDDADPFAADPNNLSFAYEDAYVATATPIGAQVGTFVKFNHAYEFDYGPLDPNSPVSASNPVFYYDGGRVEYSVDSGKHWFDAGAASAVDKKVLLVNGGYPHRITNTDHFFDDPSTGFVYTDPNPLKGKKGFTGSSHGWTSSRLDLSSLNGRKVLLRWRVATDDQLGSLGWYVDNVYAFNCNPTSVSLKAPASVRKGHAAALSAHVVRAGTTTALAHLPVQLWSRKHGTTKWIAVGTPRLTTLHGNVSWAPTQSVKTDYRVKMIGKRPFAPSNISVRTVAIG